MLDILTRLKLTRGDLNVSDTSLDQYYQSQIDFAKSDLQSEDISETVLATEIGETTIILYASLLIDNVDIVSNPTLTFLRNKLSDMTKGERNSVNREKIHSNS